MIRRFTLLFLVLFGSLRADLSPPLSVPELTSKAAVILHARVASTTTSRDESGQIFTAVEFEPIALWKGNLAKGQTIAFSGGILGEEGLSLRGGAQFACGEEFIAFLVPNKRGELICVGMDSGKFTIRRNAHRGTGEVAAQRPGEKLSLNALETLVKGSLSK